MSTVVFLHSTGLGPFMWSPFLTQVRHAQVLTPYNFGYAPENDLQRPQHFSLQDEIQHLLPQLADHDELHLIGHSWGATLALELARDRQLPVASLWLYEPVMFKSLILDAHQLDEPTRADLDQVISRFQNIHERDGGGEIWLQAFIDYWNGAGAWQAMGERAREAMRKVGWKMFQEVQAVLEETRPFADYVSGVPMQIVLGGRSPLPAQAMSHRLAANNPQAQVQLLHDAGHMSLLTQGPRFQPLLQAHLSKLGLA